MGSKDCPQKMQFLGAITKVASLGAFIQNAKVAETPHRFGRHRSKIGPNPNVLAYLAHEQGQVCVYGLMSKICLGNNFCVSKIPPVPQKNRRVTVFVFLPTLQLTALLLKSFRLRLHCYTLVHVSRSLFEMYTCRVIHLSRSVVEMYRCTDVMYRCTDVVCP